MNSCLLYTSLTRHQIGTVERALEIFRQLGLVEQLDSGAFYMTDIEPVSYTHLARKYGVDYAVKKDRSSSPPKYLIFFKGRDADALTAAFTAVSYTHLIPHILRR